MKLSDLHINPNNPRFIKDDKFKKLVKSIKDFPKMMELRPIVVDSDMMILGGNMRFRALQEAGYNEVDDSWVKVADKLTDEEKKRFIVEDNLPFGEWDWDILANNFEVSDLLDWGFDEKDLKIEQEVTEDEVPEVSNEPSVSKLGELYKLGRHWLMCGDSTKIDDIEKLTHGNDIDLIFTDPPYGMSAVTNSGVLKEKYKNDIMGDRNNKAAVDSFNLMINTPNQIWWGANYYSSCLPDSSCWLVWNKNNGGSDQMDCELAWTNLPGVTRMFTKSSEKTNRSHPTQKPVELAAWVFKKFDIGNIVLDLFGGSGSTLIACEQTNRICHIMELDPKYCDVIRKRYAKFIGKESEWITETPVL